MIVCQHSFSRAASGDRALWVLEGERRAKPAPDVQVASDQSRVCRHYKPVKNIEGIFLLKIVEKI